MERYTKKPDLISKTPALILILGILLSSCSGNSKISQYSVSPGETPVPGKFHIQVASVIDSVRFEHLGMEDGLSANETTTVLQDRTGYLWFGTKAGLNQYDGQDFTVFKNDYNDPNSLSDNWILSLHEDQDGMIWIGTLNGGLDRYDPILNVFTNFKHDPNETDSISHNEVNTIFLDSDHNLWFGTQNGLDRFNKKDESFTNYPLGIKKSQNDHAESILAITETVDGSLWVGTDGGGLVRLDRMRESVIVFTHDPEDPLSLINNHIRTVFEDSSNGLWIGTDEGLEFYDAQTDAFIHFQHDDKKSDSLSHNAVRAIYEDPSGALWIGTDGGGLNRLDRESGSFTHYKHDPSDPDSLSHQAVVFIYQDQEGILWIGTQGGAEMNKLYLGTLRFTTYSLNPDKANGLSNENLTGIDEDQEGNLWVGTKGGLNKYDRRTGLWENFLHDPDNPNSISSDNLADVLVDENGMIWVGTYDNGLNQYDPIAKEFKHYANDGPEGFSGTFATEILEDNQGTIWIATIEGGVNRYDSQTNQFSQLLNDPDDPNSISSNDVISIFEDSKGNLWIGTFTAGLNKIDRENGLVTRYLAEDGNPNSLSHNLVAAIHEDKQGTIWVATFGGLNKFNSDTETFIQYRKQEGLPGDIILGILEADDGKLWLSTDHGISSFDPDTKQFINYESHDGVQSHEFNAFSYYQSDSGKMYFGGISGLNAFDPEQVSSQNQFVPPIALTRITQGGENLVTEQNPNFADEITLKWPNNYFEFEFSALSFVEPEKNQYAYILEGFENDRNYSRNQGIGRYTNLPGGTYTLRLFGSNHDGVWNEVGHQLKIKVVPPFWQTKWFYGGLTVTILGIWYGGYQLRVRNLEKRGRELKTQVEERTSELMQTQAELKQTEMEKAISEERNRLARDLHDSVTQSIYSLTLLSEAGQRMISSGDLDQAEDNQSRLGEIAQQALQEMRLLVYELRPQMLQKEGLIGALEHRLEAVERRAGINARLHTELEIELPNEIEEEIFHLSMEALNNSLKHSGASEVEVSIVSQDNELALSIKDNGRGFDPDLVKDQGGLGITSMNERAERLGGFVSIRSKPDQGTELSVKIPLDAKTG